MTTSVAPASLAGVLGDDWRRPELRDRYGEHWIPMLLARIGRSSPSC